MNTVCFGAELSVRDVEELFFNQIKQVTRKSYVRPYIRSYSKRW